MILIVAQAFPPSPGGIQNLLAATADHIAKAGYNVTVLANGGRQAKSWDKRLSNRYQTIRFFGFRLLQHRAKALKLRQLIKSESVEAIYTDSWKSLEAIPQGLNVPIITWAHGNEFSNPGKKKKRVQKALKKASHILFISEDTFNRGKSFLPDGAMFSILHPPVARSVEPSAEDKVRSDEIWQNSQCKLLSVCRLVDLKGIDYSLNAMTQIIRDFPDARYVIAGRGVQQARYKKMAIELGLEDHVSFIGWVDGGLKTALMRGADLFVQPGRSIGVEREGYGLSYIEAALEGLPSISGKAGGAPEAIIDGETGIIIDATKPETIYQAIRGILSDKSQYNAMRLAARAHGEGQLWENRIADVLAAGGLEPAR